MIENSTNNHRFFKKQTKRKLLALTFLLIFFTIFILRPSPELIRMYILSYPVI